MPNRRWDEAQDLFDRGLNLSPAGRSAILATVDEELAAMVRTLWESNAEVGSFLQVNKSSNSDATEEIASFWPAEDAHRFQAGTVLGGRYRILDMLGRGGMGEVYKAFDLILNQHIALKFLPPEASSNKEALTRLKNEVRIARQVSHPNVCRVYDIGIVEGLHYICMEYVDGENLSSLLMRIGHLPQDKAIEIGRRLCAGLAAAHERGVLHRDLKPANIMIDGRGRVRIMDFGIAVLSHELRHQEQIGTPTYMAPEYLAGKEFTARSDIYSLGLVLSEIFTGKLRPDEFETEIDPSIERLLERCTDPDASRRPGNAMAIMLELPGGDPISAALAAGETPSPEAVAASSVREGFGVGVAAILFGVVAACMIGNAILAEKTYVMGRAPVELSTDVLIFKARELLRQFGYESLNYADWTSGFVYANRSYPDYARSTEPANYFARLASHQPPILTFFYRQSPAPLSSPLILGPGFIPGGLVTDIYPANHVPGGVVLKLDGKGRLAYLEVRTTDPAPPPAAQSDIDWNALLVAGGLSPPLLRTAPANRTPKVPYDTWVAWNGTYATGRPDEIHVEAAAFRGRPVHFAVYGPWPETASTAVTTRRFESERAGRRTRFLWTAVAFCALLIGAPIIAKRNLFLSRGDRRGAARLRVLIFSLTLTAALLIGHHVTDGSELMTLTLALSWASFLATLTGMLYLAAEPYMRRNWPDSLVSWSRLLFGQVREPLVASHILAGISGAVLLQGLRMVIAGAGFRDLVYPLLHSLEGTPHMIGGAIAGALITTFFVIGAVLMLVLFRIVARRNWLGNTVWLLLLAGSDIGSADGAFRRMVGGVFLLWLMHRFGLLVIVTMIAILRILGEAPVIMAAPNAGPSLVINALVVLAAGAALYVIAAGPPNRDTVTR